MAIFPVENKNTKKGKMVICLPYDIKDIYAFYCSRYSDIKFEKMMKMGYEEFQAKTSSIPESEPLYKIIKSRAINLNQIKDKEEKKYWRELKQENAIPDIYKPLDELESELKEKVGGIKNGNAIRQIQ